jgi:type 1 fimbriae regulatory protein FimB/type 1 fimbriae regulatory protein FimE
MGIVQFPQLESRLENSKWRNLPPRRVPNLAVRSREYLTDNDVARLIRAAKSLGRHGHRDATIIMLAYRQAFRVSELIALRWDQVDLKQGLLYINRLKNGTPSNHPIRGPEIRALRSLKQDYPETPYVFVTERKGPLKAATVRKLDARAATHAEIPFPVHPHMLRHACGYKLANDGHDTRATARTRTMCVRCRRSADRLRRPDKSFLLPYAGEGAERRMKGCVGQLAARAAIPETARGL